MTNLEREETASRMRALDKEERDIALRMFPTAELFAELQRRSIAQETMIKKAKKELGAV